MCKISVKVVYRKSFAIIVEAKMNCRSASRASMRLNIAMHLDKKLCVSAMWQWILLEEQSNAGKFKEGESLKANLVMLNGVLELNFNSDVKP